MKRNLLIFLSLLGVNLIITWREVLIAIGFDKRYYALAEGLPANVNPLIEFVWLAPLIFLLFVFRGRAENVGSGFGLYQLIRYPRRYNFYLLIFGQLVLITIAVSLLQQMIFGVIWSLYNPQPILQYFTMTCSSYVYYSGAFVLIVSLQYGLELFAQKDFALVSTIVVLALAVQFGGEVPSIIGTILQPITRLMSLRVNQTLAQYLIGLVIDSLLILILIVRGSIKKESIN